MISNTTFSEIQIGQRFYDASDRLFEKHLQSYAIRISDGGTSKFFGDDQVETAAGKWGPSTPVEQEREQELSKERQAQDFADWNNGWYI